MSRATGGMTWVMPAMSGQCWGVRRTGVRQLPGQLLQNVISHGVAKLAEFLDEDVEITAHAHQSDRMQNLGGREVQDEVRVFLRDKNGMTAFFCFSTQIGPNLNYLRLCGPKNSLFCRSKQRQCPPA